MKKSIYQLVRLIIGSVILVSVTSCKSKNNDNNVIYPQEFFICENEYVANYDFANDNHGNYSIGEIIGYLITAEDESNFIIDYPNVEYDVFDVVIGEKYDDKYDRVPVYAINEYPNRDIVCVYDLSYTYAVQQN